MTSAKDALLEVNPQEERLTDGSTNAHPMQVILQPLLPSANEGSSVVLTTNPQATIETLVSGFCSHKGLAYNPKLVIFDSSKRPFPQYSTVGSLGIRNGQNLLIGYKSDSFALKNRWPLLFAFAALIIGMIGIITLSLVYGLSGGVYPFDYGVVMDAGSSKTNTLVYKWHGSKHKGTGCVTQGDTCFAKGGIAKMDPMKLDPVIECAINVTKHIEPKSLSKTPLYFAATAGMRLLNLSNPERAKAILEQLREHLNETMLSVKAIEIISGQDEGIYAWITVNFLKHTLETEQRKNPWVPTTVGALDMGGASMQVSYGLPPEEKNNSKVTSMMLYGQEHNILSISNLCFGRDEAARRYRALLIQNPAKINVEDPCAPAGFTEDHDGSSLFKQPCTNSPFFDDWIKKDPAILTRKYIFTGTSNYQSCVKSVAKLLDDKLCLNMTFKECFKRLENPPQNQKYLAFATYFFTTDFLNLTESTLDEYTSGAQTFCEKTYAEVNQTVKNKYAPQYCFNSQYIYKVLIDGLGFSNKTWENLNFVGTISEKDVGWTLGYMINATNIIPQTKPSQKLISPAALTVSLLLLILIVAATVIFLVNISCRKKQKTSTPSKSLYGTP